MGVWLCPMNTPRGSRWGQKSQNRRLSDFCPHRGPSGVFIEHNRTPMCSRFYPTLFKVFSCINIYVFCRIGCDNITLIVLQTTSAYALLVLSPWLRFTIAIHDVTNQTISTREVNISIFSTVRSDPNCFYILLSDKEYQNI